MKNQLTSRSLISWQWCPMASTIGSVTQSVQPLRLRFLNLGRRRQRLTKPCSSSRGHPDKLRSSNLCAKPDLARQCCGVIHSFIHIFVRSFVRQWSFCNPSITVIHSRDGQSKHWNWLRAMGIHNHSMLHAQGRTGRIIRSKAKPAITRTDKTNRNENSHPSIMD